MTKKRTLLSLVIFIIMLLTLSGCVFGGTNESKQESKKSNEYTASDIKYVSDAGSEVAVVAGRSYTKTNNGMAAVALAYINGYTGPILVGQTANSISYIFYYSGKNVVSQYGSVTIDDEEWYYSKNIGFMSGNYLSFSSKGSIYCSKKTTAEDVAKEIIPMLDKTKFSANKIMTVEDLKALNDSSDSYVLGADIDLSTENNWQPIEGFKGVLNGGGYKIKNLTISAANEENLGLFKTLEGTVMNLTIENASITARGNAGKVGIVAGTNKGTIKNVIVEGSINTPYYDNVGGIAGINNNKIIDCKNYAIVTGKENVGGISGTLVLKESGLADNNTNYGEIKGTNNVGGCYGYVYENVIKTDNSFTYTLEQNENKSNVTGKENVGGIVGKAVGADRYSSSWTGYGYFNLSLMSNIGEINGTNNVGGIVGYGIRVAEITTSENNADITGANYVGGYVGYAFNTDIKLAENNNTITGKGYVGGIAGYCGIISNSKNNGTVVSTSPILENSVSRSYVGGLAGYCRGIIDSENNSDIVVNNAASYVGGIAGYVVINNNNQINNNTNTGKVTGKDSVGGIAGMVDMVIIKTDNSFTYSFENNKNYGAINGVEKVGGLFGEMLGADRYSSSWTGYGYFNISLCENHAIVIGTGDYVGGIVGYGIRVAEITTGVNDVDITGANYVGGYVGYASNASIKLAENINTITGKGYVGGIAGYCGIISNSKNNGTVVSTSPILENSVSRSYVGGLAGYCRGIIDSENNSDIVVNNAASYVGGLAGYILINNNDQINNNTNTGKVTGKDSVGGIAGMVDMVIIKTDNSFTYSFENNKNHGAINGVEKVGGLFGEMLGANRYSSNWTGYGYFDISSCENHAIVIGTGDYVGGIVGYGIRISIISLCINDANITGENYVGGYVGSADGTNIKIVANNNTITGKAYVGGIAGKAGKIEDSTNDGEIISTGVIVENNFNNSYVGGIAGYATGAINCKNNTNITINTNGNYVGGIIGFANVSNNNEMNDNENYGIITGSDYTGGIAGYINIPVRKTDNNFIITMANNKNFVKVVGKNNVGGIFGYCFGAARYSSSWYGYGYIEMTYCVNKGEIKGTSNVGGIVGGYTRLKTDANIMDTNTTDYGDKLGS